MSFWSGEKITENSFVVQDFNEAQVDANAYSLRMGDSYFVTGRHGKHDSPTKVLLQKGEPFVIPPGQFAYLLSKESVNLSNGTMAFISMRTGIKFHGLVNVSGFHVDPGYSGKLIYATYNAGPSPLQICEGDLIFKIWFSDLDRQSGDDFVFVGKAQNEISSDLVRGMSKEIYSLQSIAEKMRTLEENIESKLSEQKRTMDHLSSLWNTITTGLLVTFVVAFFTVAYPSLKALGVLILNYLQTP